MAGAGQLTKFVSQNEISFTVPASNAGAVDVFVSVCDAPDSRGTDRSRPLGGPDLRRAAPKPGLIAGLLSTILGCPPVGLGCACDTRATWPRAQLAMLGYSYTRVNHFAKCIELLRR